MFARTLSTMKSRLFDGDGADDLSDLERLDIERRLCEFEREKREIREEVESLQTQYQKTVVRAGHVDEGALDVVRDDLSRVIEAAAVARAAYQRVLIRHRVLQLLASPIHSGGPLTGLDVDPDRWSTGIRASRWVAPGHLDPPPRVVDAPPDCDDLAALARGEPGDVDATVEDVVSAARSDAPTPTLRALLESDADCECSENPRDGADEPLEDASDSGPLGRGPAWRQDERES